MDEMERKYCLFVWNNVYRDWDDTNGELYTAQEAKNEILARYAKKDFENNKYGYGYHDRDGGPVLVEVMINHNPKVRMTVKDMLGKLKSCQRNAEAVRNLLYHVEGKGKYGAVTWTETIRSCIEEIVQELERP